MPKLIFLGTSNAISSKDHENSHMVLVGASRTVLIDCPNSPFLRFEKAGVNFNALSDLVLTHFHPDHVSGVPQLLMNMWLMGRLLPLNVFGLAYTIDRIENIMELYNWTKWPGFYPVNFYRLAEEELAPVIASDEFQIFASPTHHLVPSIGLRIEFLASKESMAYSSDTEPCQPLIQLAAGVDVLVHEATGQQIGHSSAVQAGETARMAKVGSLYLIHYPTGQYASSDPVAEARREFGGPVTLAEDYMVLDFN